MILALLLQIAVPPGPGQPPATMVVEPVAMAIASFDADGDARTTRAERDAGVRRGFAAVDTGRTGKIGYIGFADWAETWLGDRNALPSPFEVDGDGDDRISLAELEAAMARAFDRLDKDRDGVVTHREALTIRASAGRPEGAPDGRRGGKRR